MTVHLDGTPPGHARYQPIRGPYGRIPRCLARATASFEVGSGAKIWLRQEMYFAFTSNTLQLGGRTEAGLKLGPVRAEGFFSYDVLVQFKPFYFVFDFSAGFSVKVFVETLRSTFEITGYIVGILVGALCFSLVLRGLGGDEIIGGAIKGIQLPPAGVIALILAIVFLLGFFLDWIEITLILLPLVEPVVQELGLDLGVCPGVAKPALVWFCVLMAVTLQTSFLTPPVGFALFYLKGVAPPEIKLGDIYRGVVPFIVLQLIGLVFVLVWPKIVLWLPSVAY